MDKKKKYKLYKTGKKVIAIGLAALTISTAGLVKMIHDYSTGDSSTSSSYSDRLDNNTNNYVDSYDDYLDVELSNVKTALSSKTSTNIEFDKENYNNVLEEINNYNYNFSMSDYYYIDENLKIYENINYNKEKNDIVITNGSLDSKKLYNIVKNNNKDYMNQDRNSINVFYSETSDSYIKQICDLIAEIYNEDKSSYSNINEISDTLSHLKIFQNNTTSASAYVSDDLVFAFNPTMMDMFSDMQEIRGNSSDGVSIDKTVFVHEIEHLFQNASNDYNESNGIEAGFCRKYDNSYVNSLWNSWLLEGSAEIKMADTLNTTPKNYDKKISYIRSYNLSRLFDEDYNINDIVISSFTQDLDEAFNLLNIKDEKSKKEFLELMYSIEITQSDTEDFWNYYQKKENITLTEDQRNSLRMDIRTEAVKKLSKKYYEGLIKALFSGKIKDLETVFYLMRLWELDCCNHLDYTNEQGFNHAADFLVWQDNIEKSILNNIANKNDISYDEILQKYDSYNMVALIDGKEVFNANFSGLKKDADKYLASSFDSYSITHFAKVKTMIEYINNMSKIK